jgi:predicted lysophospholipase L1 biosynthesis ABC-type transport system permease subunit
MEHSITLLLISATAMLLAAVGLTWARREFTRKRKDYRMSQALRRGLANPDGIRPRGLQVVQWQSCESTSVHFS